MPVPISALMWQCSAPHHHSPPHKSLQHGSCCALWSLWHFACWWLLSQLKSVGYSVAWHSQCLRWERCHLWSGSLLLSVLFLPSLFPAGWSWGFPGWSGCEWQEDVSLGQSHMWRDYPRKPHNVFCPATMRSVLIGVVINFWLRSFHIRWRIYVYRLQCIDCIDSVTESIWSMVLTRTLLGK